MKDQDEIDLAAVEIHHLAIHFDSYLQFRDEVARQIIVQRDGGVFYQVKWITLRWEFRHQM